MNDKVEFIFVVDPPNLVIESILLVSSIRRHFPDTEVSAYIPNGKIHKIPEQLTSFYGANAVKLCELPVSPFPQVYHHGNKILAAASKRGSNATIFLDTDTVIFREFDLGELVYPGAVAAAPEGRKTWGKPKFGEDWSYIYSKFGLEVPVHKVRMQRTGALSHPYYNAGVIAYSEAIEKPTGFSDIWLQTALLIDSDDKIPTKRPWLDQISLPISAARANMKVEPLDEKWNFSLSRKQDTHDEIDRINSAEPNIIHYHRLSFFSDTKFSGFPDEVISEFTVFDSLEHMNRSTSSRVNLLKDLKVRIGAIQKIAREIRTDEELKELSHLKEIKNIEMAKPTEEIYESWPESIIR